MDPWTYINISPTGDKTNDILIGYLLGLGYKVLSKTHREVL